MIFGVSGMQQIVYRGRLSAVVLAGQAIVDDTLGAGELRHVLAMCLFALEVQAGDRPGPYCEQAADAYACSALVPTVGCSDGR
jgi:hypothetical protein